MKDTKKAISPVVATALLLVVAVVSVVTFQNWFSTFSSSVYITNEEQSNDLETKVERVLGQNLYFKTSPDKNITITDVKVEGVSCGINGSFSQEILTFDLSSCLDESQIGTTQEVVVYTKNNIYSHNFIAKPFLETSLSGPAFISTWNTSLSGASASNQIQLPLQSTGNYNFEVSSSQLVNSPVSISSHLNNTLNFTTPGVHTIEIRGTIEGWRFNNGGDDEKIIEISQWGPLNLGNDGDYFYGAENLQVTANDELDLTGTTNLNNMFRTLSYSANFYYTGNISNWDTSQVQDMSYMFFGAMRLNNPGLNSWDTSNVVNMSGMFREATDFNQPLNNWNTSNVVDMSDMFRFQSNFNQNISMWDVDQVISCDNFGKSGANFPNFTSC